MKQWRMEEFGSPEKVLMLSDVILPPPGPGQIALKVKATGMSLPDLLMIEGHNPLIPHPPLTPGLEVAGEVTAVGEGAPFTIGDRVMAIPLFMEGWGGFAQFCLADSRMSARIPLGMPDVEAAGFLTSYMTAYDALVTRMSLKEGETLLVLGAAGSTGVAAVQLGKALGAHVIAVARSQAKLDLCKKLGADHGLNYKTEDIVARVKDLTKGQGANVVFDPVGGSLAKHATLCIARHGRYGLVGYGSGSWVQLDSLHMVLNAYSTFGVFMYAMTLEEWDKAYSELCRFVQKGHLKTPVAKVFSFDEVPCALLQMKTAEHPGKMIVQVE